MEYDANIIVKFRKLWVYYLVQSALATGVLAILFLVLGENRMILISAIGSTAFIVFAMPKTSSAQPKIVIGSHLIGLLSGAAFAFASLPHFVEYPVAVGIAIFLMVALDIEHPPPAAGTAIATVTYGNSLDIWLAVISSILFLSFARYLLRNHLKNLV
ncbi:MAG: HPP family protein [Planctomycetota bacterium]